jgi:uncharacterized protein (DUF433 family)
MALPATETRYEHVKLDGKGVPIIDGSSMKVIELVLEKKAYGWSPEEIHFQHPYLSLGQIYSALAYYYDHQQVLDKNIEERLAVVNRMEKDSSPSPLKSRLKSKGLI